MTENFCNPKKERQVETGPMDNLFRSHIRKPKQYSWCMEPVQRLLKVYKLVGLNTIGTRQ